MKLRIAADHPARRNRCWLCGAPFRCRYTEVLQSSPRGNRAALPLTDNLLTLARAGTPAKPSSASDPSMCGAIGRREICPQAPARSPSNAQRAVDLRSLRHRPSSRTRGRGGTDASQPHREASVLYPPGKAARACDHDGYGVVSEVTDHGSGIRGRAKKISPHLFRAFLPGGKARSPRVRLRRPGLVHRQGRSPWLHGGKRGNAHEVAGAAGSHVRMPRSVDRSGWRGCRRTMKAFFIPVFHLPFHPSRCRF
jgi:hypothetical protein